MSIKQYKKRYFICKDDNGKMIYAGDTVELHLPYETHTSYQSIIYWNRIDGAYVKQHPSHEQLGSGSYRNLRDFINKHPIQKINSETNEEYHVYAKCVKIKSFYQ